MREPHILRIICDGFTLYLDCLVEAKVSLNEDLPFFVARVYFLSIFVGVIWSSLCAELFVPHLDSRTVTPKTYSP